MANFARRLQNFFKPTPGTAWLDILLLVLSGSVLSIALFGLITEPKYACAGPGPADFGCTGGWEAVIAGVFGAVWILFFALLFVVPIGRLIYRVKNRTNKVK